MFWQTSVDGLFTILRDTAILMLVIGLAVLLIGGAFFAYDMHRNDWME